MASQTGSIDLTASNSVKLAAEAGWQSDLDGYYTKSEIDVTVGGINSTVSTKVGEDEVISSINQSSESVSINANKINLTGAVTISDLASDASGALTDAAKTATDYVTDIDSNGITVHPKRSDYATTGGRAVINGDGLTVYLGSNDVASYGASARIGKSNSDRVTVDSTNGITIYKGNSKRLQTTANGIDVYGSDGATSIASFGATARIGTNDGLHVTVGAVSGSNDAVRISDEDGNSFIDLFVTTQILPNGSSTPCLLVDATGQSDELFELYRVVNSAGTGFSNKYELLSMLDSLLIYTRNSSGSQVNLLSLSTSELYTVAPIRTDGGITANYQVEVSGYSNIALRANTVGNKGLYDTASDSWILYKRPDDTLVLNDPLYIRENTCTVNTTNASASGDNKCWHNGAAVSFAYVFSVKSALASGSSLAVGTLPSGYRPPYNFAAEVYTSSAANVLAVVSTAGVITIRNVGSGSLATTTTIRVSGTFVS